MELEPARLEDLTALHALIERAYRGDSARRGWTHEADLLGGQRTDLDALREMHDDPAQRLLLWRDHGVPAACVALTDKGDGLAYLGMVTVDPERQGGGTGRALLDAAERWAADRLGTHRVEMTVIRQRAELIAWYERRGYHLTGEGRPFPYGDERFGKPNRDDLEFVVLEKTL